MVEEAKPKISCKNVWKVFGPGCQKIVEEWDAYKDMDKVKRLKETGCVVGTREANFHVERGEIYCLMGLSGSGKSTLLRCINRLHEPTHGKVFIDDEDITTLSQQALRQMRRKKTSMVFQHFALLPHHRLLRNAAFGLEVQGIEKKEREKRALEALELVGLKGWESSYPYELSGGMQQRVGLARALATDPEILLMDEAFSALDPLIRRQMQDEFVKLIKKVKKTIVFVTHDLNEALRIAGHIAVMKDGAIVQQGTPAEIVLHPETDYVAEFVRDLPKVKFITAADIVEEPDKWILSTADSCSAIIAKMDERRLRFAFIVGEDQRIKSVVDYFYVSRSEPQSPDALPTEEQLYCEHQIPTASPNTFLEVLLAEGAKSKVPTVVKDADDRIIGVISREKLLTTLTSV